MVVALAERPVARPAAAEAALDIATVSHQFALKDAPLPVLNGISLRVAPGEFVALLGPSGCGKSTLLRLVAGLERPTAGRITGDDGREITGPDPSRVVVFQDPTLYPWRTVRQNVALGPQARGQTGAAVEKRMADALRLVGLAGFADAYPHQLSGGMAQRAALARALVNEPRLLLMDEPLGKLDSLTRLTMQGELVRLWQDRGFTALLVTHDVEEALLMATRVVVLSDRPARVLAEIPVDRPYPRHRDDSGLVALRRKVLELLGMERTW
jgi:NitT/TauT family transport system ATP-binding protein